MIGSILQKATLGAFVGVATLAINVSDADAWWRHGSSGGSYGSWGSSGGSWGSSGGSWGSSGGSWGSSGGIIHRIRARRAWRHYYHSSGGSYGSHGSSGGSHGSWGSSGGSYGSWGSQGGAAVQTYRQDQPMPPNEAHEHEGAEPSDQPPLPPIAGESDDQVRYAPNGNSALVGVRVPAGASVFVNGRPTRSAGVRRWYVSRGLEPGRAYAYEIRVELMRGDESLVETKRIRVRGGQRADLEFRFEETQTAQRPSDDSPRTTLILRVPEDAKVTLAGRETKANGPVREFSTTKLLAAGQWADYPVRVEIQRDGKTLVQKRTITLAAGQKVEETFDFDAPQVAQVLAAAGQ